MGQMWGKIDHNFVEYLSVIYRVISPNFDKGVFKFPDVHAYAKL